MFSSDVPFVGVPSLPSFTRPLLLWDEGSGAAVAAPGSSASPLALRLGLNVLAADPRAAVAALEIPSAAVSGVVGLVSWSGSMAGGLFERSPLTWLSQGSACFGGFCDAAEPVLVEAGLRLCFRTHARHALPDPTAAKAFLGHRDGGCFGVLYDPAACMEECMGAYAADHLSRGLEIIGARCDAVLLTARFLEDASLVQLLGGLLADHVPASTPVALPPVGHARAAAALGIASP